LGDHFLGIKLRPFIKPVIPGRRRSGESTPSRGYSYPTGEKFFHPGRVQQVHLATNVCSQNLWRDQLFHRPSVTYYM